MRGGFPDDPIIWWLFFLVIVTSHFLVVVHSGEEPNTCSASTTTAATTTAATSTSRAVGSLRPSDLPPVKPYSNWTSTHEYHTTTTTTTKNNATSHDDNDDDTSSTQYTSWMVKRGIIPQVGDGHYMSEFDMLQGVVPRDQVQQIRNLLAQIPSLDQDPDTVDGFATQEMFLDNPALRQAGNNGAACSGKPNLESPQQVVERQHIRQALLQITRPLLQERIEPYVRKRYPEICQTFEKHHQQQQQSKQQQRQQQQEPNHPDAATTAACNLTACYSLLRRYQHGERQSHAPHRDRHAVVTVVVSLSDYGTEYQGGLYVMAANNNGQASYLPLNRGDAAVHLSDLWHGVKVVATNTTTESTNTTTTTMTTNKQQKAQQQEHEFQRWSWILWFHDTADCNENASQYYWFADCAAAGNPTCEYLHATKVGQTPGLTAQQQQEQVIHWNRRAALHNHPTACVKLARAYQGKLPSGSVLTVNRTAARGWYQRAVDSTNDPDAHYGLASMLLEDLSAAVKLALSNEKNLEDLLPKQQQDAMLDRVIAHLEVAAFGGHPFAMFNLGLVHLLAYGTAVSQTNPRLAAEWFEASGLPEGLAATSFYYSSMGQVEQAKEYQRRAVSLGFGSPWRIPARQQTGYGGAAGVDLNLEWPPNDQQQVPPKW